jgi:hypothetical protein
MRLQARLLITLAAASAIALLVAGPADAAPHVPSPSPTWSTTTSNMSADTGAETAATSVACVAYANTPYQVHNSAGGDEIAYTGYQVCSGVLHPTRCALL